ncbi:MAG: hybrid sensor histidine kinase/response regulator [Chloroflexales bacterium]|nr:hybrid sensor histidine kinase/response regulator [Chloroflexales bacterium]
MLNQAEISPFDEVSHRTNLEDLRSQLTQRLIALLIGASFLVLWLTLPEIPFPTILFSISAVLLVLGMGLRRIATINSVLARHLLVWGLTGGLLGMMWLFSDPWLPFLGPLLILIGAILVSGSELAIMSLIGLVATGLVCIGSRDYPIYALMAVLVLGTAVSFLGVRALYTALAWADTMRRRADNLLEKVRTHRAELFRALKSSELANMTLQRTEQELIAARKQADQARRLKEQFAVNISHELRTPLNLILGFSEMMYLSPEVYGLVDWPVTLRRDVHQIYRSSRHLLEMIDDVLDLSRVEMASFTLNIEPTQLEPLLQDTATIAADLFRGHSVYLNVEVAPDLPRLDIDRTRIRQVLLNLLNNAQRFTTEGSVTLTARQVGNEVVVSVSDTGPGIPADKLPHVFDEFFQVDLSLRRSYQGAGLGLAISKRFVEAHRGYIWVESEEGRGSTFSFALPIVNYRRSTTSATAGDMPESARPNTPPNILVVDPDPAVAGLIDRRLKEHEVIQVADMGHLAQAVDKHHPHAVVYNMPPGERNDLNEGTLNIPVPVIKCSLPSQTWLIQELAVVACLAKPITSARLMNEIKRLGDVHQVLIIDDDRGFSQLITRILEAAGQPFELRRAYDGQDGLAAMRTEPPDLVLLDLVMPEVDGFQVLGEMRQDPELDKIPVIVLTATSYAEDALNQHGKQLIIQYAAGLSPHKVLEFLQTTLGLLQPDYGIVNDEYINNSQLAIPNS